MVGQFTNNVAAEIQLPGCRLDLGRGTLVRRGTTLTSRRQVVRLLAYLCTRRNTMVSREELARALWADGGGSDGALNFCVARAREVLQHVSGARLVTIRGRGYRLELEPESRGVGPGTLLACSRHTPPAGRVNSGLLERSKEIAVVTSQLEDAATWRQPRITLVSSDVGFGKTALGGAIEVHAASRGFGHIWSGCIEGETEPPGWPWPDVLERLRGEDRPGAPDSDQLPAPIDTQRHRFCGRVLQALSDYRGGVPLLVVLDNMHLADELALSVCHHLLARGRSLPVHVVLLVRTQIGARESEGLSMLRTQAVEISLPPLSREASRCLIRRCHPGMNAELEQAVLETGRGNPLFLVKACARASTNPSLDSAAVIRHGLAHVLPVQLKSLPARATQLLHVAAVLGMRFQLPVVASALEWSIAEAQQYLQPALSARMVLVASTLEYRFDSESTRQFLVDEIGSIEKAVLHWRIGLALRLSADNCTGRDHAAAYHLTQGASDQTQAALAFDACEESGTRALRDCSFEAAASRFSDALAMSELARPEPQRLIGVLCHSAFAHRHAGRLGQARECAWRALRLADQNANGEYFAEAALRIAELSLNRASGNQHVLEALLRAALRIKRGTERHCHLLLCTAELMFASESADISSLAREARQVYSDAQTARAKGLLDCCEVLALWNCPDESERLLELLERASTTSDEAEDRERVAKLDLLYAGINLRLCRMSEYRHGIRQAAQVAEQMPFSAPALLVSIARAALAAFRGQLQSTDLIAHAYQQSEQVTPERVLQAATMQRLLYAVENPSSTQLSELISQVPVPHWSTRSGQVHRAFFQAMLGDDAGSFATFEHQASDGLYDANANDSLGVVALRCELAAHHGDRRYARQTLDALSPFASQLATIGCVDAIVAPLGFSLGALATLVGDLELAHQLYSRGAAASQLVGAFNWVRRCQLARERLRDMELPTPLRIRRD